MCQREVVGGHDACAGHKEGAIRERVVAEEIAGEFGGFTLEFGECGCAVEGFCLTADDLDLDRKSVV